MKPGQRNWQYANGPLMINALLMFLLLLAITMKPAAGITVPLPLELPLQQQQQHHQQQQQQQQYHHQHQHHQYHQHPYHTRSNYYVPESEPETETAPESEALAGLAGYTQHYYGANSAAGMRQTLQDNDDVVVDGDIGDLAATPYANYEPKAVTANGFVPTTALHGYNNNYNNYNNYNNRLHSNDYDVVGGQRGKIDFVINTANYEEQPPAIYYQSYGYQPQTQPQAPPTTQLTPLAPLSLPLLHYPIEQFSNYHQAAAGGINRERHLNDDNGMLYAGSLQRATFAVQQHQQQQQQQQHQQQQLQHEQHHRQQRQHTETHSPHKDQQLSADLPGSGKSSGTANSLPPITTSVHHTPLSSKAIAGLPLYKHIEVTKNVPVTHYQRQHVPYKQSVPLRVSRPVITTIPKPIPIRVPVTKTVAVPQLQEVKIPIEKIKPVAVDRPVPFVVERRVPYRVEKPVVTPVYYPYPVKVPVVRTVVHKQKPVAPHRWAPLNHLLG